MTNPFDRVKILWKSSPGQKRLVLWAVKFSVVFLVFFAFFFPLQRELGAVSSNIRSLKSTIADLKNISVNLLTPQEILETEKRVEEFEAKLVDPSQGGALLDRVTDEAEKDHFNVIQIYSDTPIPVKNETGKDLELRGKRLQWLPVSFRVHTDYKNLASFLKALMDDPKFSCVVESLQVQRPAAESEKLQCDVTLSFISK